MVGEEHRVPGVRVVLVDNDPGALELLELDLTLEGHEIVATAAQGLDGITAVADTAPEVAIVDFRMPPGIDGLEVARQLRRRSPEVRVLLYSNHVRPELVDEATRLGVPYLRKGDLDALRRAVLAG
jgi:two-component system, response regulator YesN